MWLRFLPFLFLLLLSQASAMQQEPIDVPFENAGIVGRPIEVTGNITVQETVAGNEVSSLWVENVVARNISNSQYCCWWAFSMLSVRVAMGATNWLSTDSFRSV